MNEKGILIAIHFCLIVLQLLFMGLALGVDSKFATAAPVISGAQAFFPNPFKTI